MEQGASHNNSVAAAEQWAISSLFHGHSIDEILQVADKESIPLSASDIRGVLLAVQNSNLGAVVREILYRFEKTTSLMDTIARVSRDRFGIQEVGRVSWPCLDNILDGIATSAPLLVDGLFSSSRMAEWTPEYLLNRLGSELKISVMSGRSSDERYEENFENHFQPMSFGEFIDALPTSGNDLYLTARDGFLFQESTASLRNDLPVISGLLGGAPPKVWIGPSGTITPLHHDDRSVLIHQIYGSKRIDLISPLDSGRLPNDYYCWSAFSTEIPDYLQYPAMQEVPILRVVLSPGQTLVIPVGWWHSVHSTSVSISATFDDLTVDTGWRQSYPGDPKAPQNVWRKPIDKIYPRKDLRSTIRWGTNPDSNE
jgi:Cupin-like domain